jgi:hypothetical protein
MRANGDGDSTLKVIDLYAVTAPIKQIVSTGGTTRIDEMALTSDARRQQFRGSSGIKPPAMRRDAIRSGVIIVHCAA